MKLNSAINIIFNVKKQQKVKKVKSVKSDTEDDKYLRYLESFDIKKKPERVDLKAVPKAYGGTAARVRQQATLTFWAVKAKVCRPYQR